MRRFEGVEETTAVVIKGRPFAVGHTFVRFLTPSSALVTTRDIRRTASSGPREHERHGDDTDATSIGSVRLDFHYDEIWDTIIDLINKGGLASDSHCKQLLTVVDAERKRLSLDPLDFNGAGIL